MGAIQKDPQQECPVAAAGPDRDDKLCTIKAAGTSIGVKTKNVPAVTATFQGVDMVNAQVGVEAKALQFGYQVDIGNRDNR